MKYCTECGTKLDLENKDSIKSAKKSNKKGFIISAGVLIIIAASLCFILGTSALLNAINTSGHEYPGYYDWYYENYSYQLEQLEMKFFSFIAVFSFSAFVTGLIAGILILKKAAFNLAIIGLANVNVAAMLSIGNDIGMFLAIGLPVFVLSMISILFTIHSKDRFNQ